jgi:sterol 3beta-glucosyltransferase
MRLTIFAIGTRGDVEPFVALGIGLNARGHVVTVATHERFRGDVESRGLSFRTLPGDPVQVFDDPAWHDWQPSPWRPGAHARLLRSALAPLFEQITPDHYASACRDADAVLVTLTTVAAQAVAQEHGLPCVGLLYGPLYRTRQFAQPTLFPTLRAGGLVNALSYPVADWLLGQPFREPLRPAARRRVALSPIPFRRNTDTRWPPFPIVHGFSESIVPRPPDWPSHLYVTGSWITPPETDAALPEAAESFLEAGAPPIFIGFGSTRVRQVDRLLRMIVNVTRLAGERLIIGPGWAGLGRGLESDEVFVADLPAGLLFPRVKAVIHHGGAGTTAIGLAAGRPTLVIPFVSDQHFWGARVADLGAGPKPVYAHRLTADRLLAAVEALGRRDVRDVANRIGERMRAEDGIERGAELVERLIRKAR